MAPSSASLTTFFVVGPEEYVEFAESMGSKAFLQHIWDNSVTPLTRQELDSNSRLHNTGARIVRPENGPPRIEFPTVKRLRGNRYKPTGKWISWQALKRLNPLAVTDPPDLNIFMARGGTVGSGERRAPGAYLEQTTSKNLIPFAVPEEPVASNTNLDEGMESQSYAPAPNGDDAAMPIPAGAATPPRPRTNKPSLNVNSQGWIGIGSAQSIHAPPRAVVVRRARQTSSPAALAAKAALAAGRPGPSPLANSVAGSNATVTPANAHILRSAAAAAGGNSGSGSGSGSGTAPSSPSAASTSASVTPVSTPPARSSSRFSHGTSASVSGISAYTTPPPSSSALGPRSGSPHGSLSTPPPSGSYQPSTPGSAGSAGSGSSRASRRPNLRVPMPPPPQHLSSSFRNAGGSGSGSGGGASASTATGGPAVGGGLGAGSAAPPASSASGTTALTPGALTPGYASGARTPLSATHPPPETPLKHQRRRAKETAAALATAAAVVAGGTETSSGSGTGIGIGNRKGARTSDTEIAAGAATGTLSGSRAKDSSSGDGYVDADDERDPMDFAPTAGNAAAAVTRDGPSSFAMSPGSSANGGIGGGRSPMGSATHLAGLAHSSLGLGLGGPGGAGGGTPDLRALSNLNRADVERTRLAFERTAAGQDPLLSASANARSGAGGPVASPFSSGWSPAGGPASALMAAGGSGGAGPMAPPGSMFGSWAGLGDWAMGGASQQQQQQQQQQSNAHVAATAAAMVAAIAEARRSSLPPLTPATEGMPYPGAMGLPPVRTPNTTYDEEGPSGIGLGLETGPPVGRPSRPSIYGSFLETPPNGAVASSSLSSSLLEAKPRLSPSSLVSPSLVFPPTDGSRSSRRNANGSGGERSRDTSTGSGGSAAGCREGLSAEGGGGGGGGGGGSSSSDDLDGDGDGSAAGSGISLNRQGSDQGSLASSFQFVRLGGAGPGPSSTAVLAQASPSSTTVTQHVVSAVAEPEPVASG
ncbi:hypothetical protein OC835_007241 [Tilletia horrida]|nr:hypothetical protein OC835_007241 [Tilletia horrida]